MTKETPSNWSAEMITNVFQSAESVQEQSLILETLKNLIVESLFAGHNFNKHQFILGPPGTGKTYVLTMALGFALSKGLLTRLSEHNCGNGSDFTKPPHRLPWAVTAFVCNFLSSFSRRDFEEELHREMYERRHRLKTLNDMTALFQEKVSEKNCGLHFCVCGQYRAT